MAETTSVWFDCDTGFDDLLALVVASRDPSLRLAGVSTVVGNTSLDNTTANTLAAVEAFGIDAPVYRGCAQPIAGPPHTIEGLLGEGGMGTTGRRLAPARRRRAESRHAVRALIAYLRAAGEPALVVATGPLTNLAQAINLAPDVAAKIGRLVVMGGSAGAGNHTAAAEFNAFADPEAWDVVLRAGAPLEMFGLNLTRQVLIGPSDRDRIAAVGTDLAGAVADSLDAYLRIRQRDKPGEMPLHDPCTTVYLARPDWFALEPARVEIELAGRITRGATVCEFRVPRKAQPNALVATRAEGSKVAGRTVDQMVAALRAAA
ncbi:MAG: nucleoside hydrolase [Bifidobacteriaceae bacterium]|jgi:inosine-uridine nucleoside N-ribohydrolase|nr:nucleoside hydrolase [Bifidobacteriaceae bacterium]